MESRKDVAAEFRAAIARTGDEMRQVLVQSFDNLVDFFMAAGFSSDQVDQWLTAEVQALQVRSQTSTAAAVAVAKEVRDVREELFKLSMDLGRGPVNLEPGARSIGTYADDLKGLAAELRAEKQKRLGDYARLRDRSMILAQKLGGELSPATLNPVPTRQDMDKADEEFQSLKALERTRSVRTRDLEEEIFKHLIALGRGSCQAKGEDGLTLTAEDVRVLDKRCEDLGKEVAERKAERNHLETLIRLKAMRLGRMDDFRVDIPLSDVSDESLASVRSLAARASKEYQSNMALLVSNARAEMEHMHEKLHYTADDKASFAELLELSPSAVDEALLEQLFEEGARLRLEYEGKEKILRAVDERGKLLQRLEELHQRDKDPKKFQNRAGKLEMEMREQEKCCRDLGRMEKETAALVRQWEVSNGKPFLLGGKSLEQLITEHAKIRRNEWKHPTKCLCFWLPKEGETSRGLDTFTPHRALAGASSAATPSMAVPPTAAALSAPPLAAMSNSVRRRREETGEPQAETAKKRK